MKNETTKVQNSAKRTIPVPDDLHRELKIASAHREESISELLRKAWESFKAKEGKRLHDPVVKEMARAS